MDFDEVIRRRHSVRSYLPHPPSNADIVKILEAADMAPSAGGLKARQIFVITSEPLRKKLAAASLDQEFIAEAPVVVLFCSDLERIAEYGDRGRDLYCIQDTAAAVENALLKAVDLGLGACWVGAFHEDEVSHICGLPAWLRPTALVTIGFEK